MKKIIKYILIVTTMLFVITGCNSYNYEIEKIDGKKVYNINNTKYVETDEKTNLVKIDVNGYGIIIAALYPDIAPITVENFQKLVSEKYYDDLEFHRVIKDFMIQTGNGKEKTDTIKGEFELNGYENKLIHTRGVLSMARLGAEEETEETLNSASSQFFIMQKTTESLDGKYASFGEVIDGIEIVDKIANRATDNNDKPTSAIYINTIRFVSVYEEKKLNYTKEIKDDKTIYKIEDKKYIETDEKTNLVKIEINNYGIMIAELYPNIAPITVKNFKKLVSNKYYDYLTFHRIIKDFMIQTGDETGTGSGGSKDTIKGEFKINGFDNKLSHTRGVLSMARLGAETETKETMNSATSQFFIVHNDSTYLDGNYASFGKLLYGYDILDELASSSTDSVDKPVDTKRILSIRFVKEGE